MEVAIATSVVAALVVLSLATMRQWSHDQHGEETTRAFASLLRDSRARAVKDGVTTVVFFQTDRRGRPLLSEAGDELAALAIRDLDGDGEIGPDERIGEVAAPPEGALSWGHTAARLRARGDPAGSPDEAPVAAITFQAPDGSATSWVAFGPDGHPRTELDQSLPDAAGSGGGAVYLTSGSRDFAVVLTPLGKTYVRTWEGGSQGWSR